MNEEAIVKLTKDLRKTAGSMTINEARFLVDAYYQMQENRIRSDGQIRSVKEEPHAVLSWLSDNASFLENQIKAALTYFANSHQVGQWAISVRGVGPVIAAGLLAHIDITKAPTVGHIWRFAGLDPTLKWGKGEKRPWNAALKKLCYLIGESFVKVHNHPEAFYGRIYAERKALELQKNDRGEFAEQAKAILEAKPKHAQAATYKTGKLPDGHIHMRAKRYAVKLFLSHYHTEAYRHHFGKEPPLPYPIAHMGHAHQILPPSKAA